ncbi:MAG: TRAP transporter large permease subunit [Rhodoferax sp.]|nr:TRAP transporter large permease subunit [Rhodoferax sp.]
MRSVCSSALASGSGASQANNAPYSVVIVASSAIFRPIIPPSILMVICSSMTGESVGALFVAGIGPGLLITEAGVVAVT